MMNFGMETKTTHYRVLVVDDNSTGRDLIEPYIEAAWGNLHHVEVLMTPTLDEALNLLSTSNFAALIIVWKSAIYPAGVFLRNMRGYGIRTPVVIISNLQRGDIRDDIEASGAVFLNRGMLSGVALRDAVSSSLRLINTAQSNPDGVKRRFPFRSKPPPATPPV